MLRFSSNPVSRVGQGLLLGVVCALLTLVADRMGVLNSVKGGALDTQFRGRGIVFPSPDIVIVEADDSTITRYGQWPLPRRIYGQLVKRLSDAGAKTIAFDVLFSVPSGSPRDDAELIEATEASKRVIHAAVFSFESERDPMLSVGAPNNASHISERFRLPDVRHFDGGARQLPQTVSGSAPLHGLQEKAVGLGHVNAPPEEDGVLRRIPHVLRFHSGRKTVLYPSLALAAAANFLGVAPGQIEMGDREIVVPARSGARHIPLDEVGTTWVNWIGPHDSFPTYSFNSILDGRVPDSELKGKLVLIGITAAGSFERHPTPFSPVQPAVELQANALDDILMNRSLEMAPIAVSWALLLALPALIGALTLLRGARLSAVVLLAVAIAAWFVPVFLLSHSHLLVPVALPLLASLLAWSGGAGLRQFLDAALLRGAEERYALSVRGANDGLWDWNLQNGQIYFSPRWKAMLGFEDDEIGDEIEEWYRRVHPDDLETLKTQLKAHLGGASAHFESEHRMIHRDGRTLWVLSRGLRVCNVANQATRMAGSQSDISERIEAQKQLERSAFFDSLTGLPNRALFMNDLSRALLGVTRRGKSPIAVLFLDLDRFKTVNDSLGHASGDTLLMEVARRLESCLRSGDTAARLGGDEFTVLLAEIEGLSDATRIAERILRELTRPFLLEGQEVFPSASIGIALSSPQSQSPENLLRDADTAMYRAKAQNYTRLAVFDEAMHAHALSLLRLETDLRHALEREEFLVFYQPIVALQNGALSGFEALVRWNHPQRGMISPAEFIPLAEETGLIIALDHLVMRLACAQMRRWQLEFPARNLSLSVNLSSQQFAQSDLVEQVDRTLRETGLPAGALKLEITEGVLMDNPERAAEMLRHLQSCGIRLSIDDFGTGYSSLSYLHQFSLDTLKIDQSFVRRIGENSDSAKNDGAESNEAKDHEVESDGAEIVHTIAALARNLRMDIVAEGIETREQMMQLRAIGCEYGQGYFFARPLPAAAAEALIEQNTPYKVENKSVEMEL